MGVDWMSMELSNDPASFNLWHAIKDWVEGVKLLAELNSDDEALFAKTIIDARPDGILIPQGQEILLPPTVHRFCTAENFPGELIDEAYMIVSFHPTIHLALNFSVKEWDRIFLETDWTPELLSGLLDTGYQGGIVLSGSEESEKGIKDFALTDELILMLRGE
jgi:hypothetical protein